MLTPERIVIWNDPPTKDELFKMLALAVTGGGLSTAEEIVRKVQEREKTGSTFLNEGVALPHARIGSLSRPEVVLGLTHNGVLDHPTEQPIEVVFLLLSPATGPRAHLQLLSKAARLLQNRELRRRLAKIQKPAEALEEILDWERSGGSGK
jgi:mannitol/fructose-specific phosphotransferase system IIA component (Ntr-type)